MVTFHCMKKKTQVRYSALKKTYSVESKRKSYRFQKKWGWLNNNRIVFFYSYVSECIPAKIQVA